MKRLIYGLVACTAIYMIAVTAGTVLDFFTPYYWRPGKLFMFWGGMLYSWVLQRLEEKYCGRE